MVETKRRDLQNVSQSPPLANASAGASVLAEAFILKGIIS